MVEHVLAKDETGVRFSLAAQKREHVAFVNRRRDGAEVGAAQKFSRILCVAQEQITTTERLAEVVATFLPSRTSQFCLSLGFVLKVDKGVHSGDKGHETFCPVREILSK